MESRLNFDCNPTENQQNFDLPISRADDTGKSNSERWRSTVAYGVTYRSNADKFKI